MTEPTNPIYTVTAPKEGTTNTYETIQDISGYAINGRMYKAFARAEDNAGNMTDWIEIDEFLYYDSTDTDPPQFFNPSLTVSESTGPGGINELTLAIDAIDEKSGVKFVRFYQDDGTDPAAPSAPFTEGDSRLLQEVSSPSGNTYSLSIDDSDVTFSTPVLFWAVAFDYLDNTQLAVVNGETPYTKP